MLNKAKCLYSPSAGIHGITALFCKCLFWETALRCMRSEQYLQSSKVVPGEERARRLRSSSLSRVTCLSWNRTVSIFSFTWWLSMWAGGGEEAWPGVPAWVSMSLVACAVHKAQMMGEMSAAPSLSLKCSQIKANRLKCVADVRIHKTLVHVLFLNFLLKTCRLKETKWKHGRKIRLVYSQTVSGWTYFV